MAGIDKILAKMRDEPYNLRYAELFAVCPAYFGKPRQTGSSHAVFKTPWIGDPRINIQNANGKAKPYQIRQVLATLEKLNSQ